MVEITNNNIKECHLKNIIIRKTMKEYKITITPVVGDALNSPICVIKGEPLFLAKIANELKCYDDVVRFINSQSEWNKDYTMLLQERIIPLAVNTFFKNKSGNQELFMKKHAPCVRDSSIIIIADNSKQKVKYHIGAVTPADDEEWLDYLLPPNTIYGIVDGKYKVFFISNENQKILFELNYFNEFDSENRRLYNRLWQKFSEEQGVMPIEKGAYMVGAVLDDIEEADESKDCLWN